MNEPLASVIVPVYNRREYLSECVESILSQTMQDFELILVDDGSTDQSGEECQERYGADGRVHILRQEHSGVGAARNMGLEAARGKFVTFVDSDDFIARESLAILVSLAQETETDIVWSLGDFILPGATNQLVDNPWNGTLKGHSYDSLPVWLPDDIGERLDMAFSNLDLCPNVWNKLYRRAFLEKYHIRFPEDMEIDEDFQFNFACFCHAHRIRLTDRHYYVYRITEESSMRTSSAERAIHRIVQAIIFAMRHAGETMERVPYFHEHPEYEKRYREAFLIWQSRPFQEYGLYPTPERWVKYVQPQIEQELRDIFGQDAWLVSWLLNQFEKELARANES